MSEEKKSKAKALKDALLYNVESAWITNRKDENVSFEFCEDYKNWLNKSKTERECVDSILLDLSNSGYVEINTVVKSGKKLEKGDKVYWVSNSKAVLAAIIGETPLREGINMIGSHIDSPRLDIKQNPLYENTDFVFLKTHYYGGIKKYQWVAIPLALHGVIIKKDGKKINIRIGEKPEDPVFTIPDLLPHLGKDQMAKKMSEGIKGEGLNLLFGSKPYNEKDLDEKVKINILNLLKEQYNVLEEDFLSAELEVVPAFPAQDVGLDRSMLGGYGHDDRVCAYGSLQALLNIKNPQKTALCIFSDKEEIGSVGNTGADSTMLENFIARLCAYSNKSYNDIMLRDCLENSYMLSADVSAAVDPNYEGTHDKYNASYAGKGMAIMKYSGARGKSGASDANPEFIALLRKLFDENKVAWQTTELGAVDKGGGGTIAMMVANLGVNVIDCGVPLLGMHSPFEVASKIDIYMCYKAYVSFFDKFNQ